MRSASTIVVALAVVLASCFAVELVQAGFSGVDYPPWLWFPGIAAYNKAVYLLGGHERTIDGLSDSRRSFSLWKFDITTKKWDLLSPTSALSLPSDMTIGNWPVAGITSDGVMYATGGVTNFSNSTWGLNLAPQAVSTWNTYSNVNGTPDALVWSTYYMRKDELYVFNGDHATNGSLSGGGSNSSYIFSAASKKWRAGPSFPENVSRGLGAYNPVYDVGLFFGGVFSTGVSNDAYVLLGKQASPQWILTQSLGVIPQARYLGCAVSVFDQFWIYGGFAAGVNVSIMMNDLYSVNISGTATDASNIRLTFLNRTDEAKKDTSAVSMPVSLRSVTCTAIDNVIYIQGIPSSSALASVQEARLWGFDVLSMTWFDPSTTDAPTNRTSSPSSDSTSTSSPTVAASANGGLETGAIIGIVAGVIVVIAAVGAFVFMFIRRKRQKPDGNDTATAAPSLVQHTNVNSAVSSTPSGVSAPLSPTDPQSPLTFQNYANLQQAPLANQITPTTYPMLVSHPAYPPTTSVYPQNVATTQQQAIQQQQAMLQQQMYQLYNSNQLVPAPYPQQNFVPQQPLLQNTMPQSQVIQSPNTSFATTPSVMPMSLPPAYRSQVPEVKMGSADMMPSLKKD